jgi:hypothetical protein
MNGAVISYKYHNDQTFQEQVFKALIPKLAAPIIPPRLSDIRYKTGSLQTHSKQYQEYANDFIACGKILSQDPTFMAHTSVESLNYRNKYYKRIVRVYLDKRSGMSYGFLVWQLPTSIHPVLNKFQTESLLKDTDKSGKSIFFLNNKFYIRITLNERDYILEVPDVYVLSTRSGCQKTQINPDKDLVRMGLSKGRIIFEMPQHTEQRDDIKPSYDTITILAHAIGNALLGSILMTFDNQTTFPSVLKNRGVSMLHWHGYPTEDVIPTGYVLHGIDQPSVPCASPQSAIYALLGKFQSLQRILEKNTCFRGDVHIEPHHGTNITGVMSLADTAQWIYGTLS